VPFPSDLPRTRLKTILVRVVKEGVDPLSSAGSQRLGGRYNEPGETGTLYTSLGIETALAEVARHAKAPLHARWWQYTLRVDLIALDLTDANVGSVLGLAQEALTGDDLSLPRRLASEARRAGFQALIVPSAVRAAEKNVVLFLDTLQEKPEIIKARPADLD
jgi:RES domain-containing protein